MSHIFISQKHSSLTSFEDFQDHLAVPLSLTHSSSEVQLEKTVNVWGGIALIIGSIIGSGIFSSPGPIILYAGSVGMALSIWLIAGLLSTCGALCYAELGTSMPLSGGEHPYFMRAYGSLPAFLFSFTGVTVTRPASVAIICLVFAEYTVRLFYNSSNEVPNALMKFIAWLGIISLAAVNCYSVRWAGNIQAVSSILKVISLFIIGIIGIFAMTKTQSLINEAPLFESPSSNPTNYALALYSALWAYDGWSSLNLVVGELKDPSRNLPRALIGGLLMVIICYLLANVAYYAELPRQILINSTSLAMDFGAVAFGDLGRILIPIVIIASTYGAANASVFTGARVSLISSQKNHAPQFLGVINEKTKTPFNAVLFQCSLSTFYVIIGHFKSLVTFYSIISWTFYFLAVLGLLLLRKNQPLMNRPFKVWIAVPVVFCSSSLFLLACSIVQAPLITLCSFLFMAVGTLLWFIIIYRDNSWDDMIPYMSTTRFSGRATNAHGRYESSRLWQYENFHDDQDDEDDNLNFQLDVLDKDRTDAWIDEEPNSR